MNDFTSEQILKYIQERYKTVRMLGIYIVDLFKSQDLIATTSEFGQITGVLIFRKVKLTEYNDLDRTSHNEKGDTAFVVECCADGKKELAMLAKQMEQRLGKVKHIGMHRRGRLHFYDYNKYLNKLLGKDR
jgi:hypothetical protein